MEQSKFTFHVSQEKKLEFLNEQGIYDQWEDNVYNALFELEDRLKKFELTPRDAFPERMRFLLNEVDDIYFLRSAFIWEHTPQKGEFWKRMNVKWLLFVMMEAIKERIEQLQKQSNHGTEK